MIFINRPDFNQIRSAPVEKNQKQTSSVNPGNNKSEPVVEHKNSLSYPSRTLDPPISMVDRVKEIELAGSIIESHVNSKLDIILKQIQNLQNEAKKVIEQAEEDMLLHRIKCNFEKRIGMTIHLYGKPNGEKYFSMLSREEFNNPAYLYFGAYIIKPDQSFEKISQV